jgi:hypothetical protein
VASKGTLTVRALLDAKEFSRGLKDMGTRLDRQGRKLKDLGNSLTRNVSLPLAAGAVAAVKFASDQNEALSKVNVTFRRSAREVERWAGTSAQAMGQSKAQALDAAGGFGAMLQAMGLAEKPAADMSMSLVQLAGDMASFNNASPEDMLVNLRSALAGEVEPLRKFGVNVSAAAVTSKALEMGLADANGEVTEAAKVQARYALIMEQTSAQQGDFARTSGEVANQTRIVAAEAKDAAAQFGTQLLPVAKDLLGVAGGLVKAFGAMPGPLKQVVAGAGLLAIAAGPVIRGLGSMASLGGGLVGKLRVLDKATGKTSISLAKLGGMLGRGGLVGAGLVVATVLLGAWISAKQKATQRAQEYTAAIEADSGALADNTRETLINRLEQEGLLAKARELGIATGDLTKALLGDEDAMRRVTSAIDEAIDPLAKLRRDKTGTQVAAEDLDRAIRGEDAAIRTATEGYERQQEELRASTRSTEDATTATDGWSRQLEDMRPIMDGWVGRAGDMADQLGDTGDEADKTRVEFLGLTDAIERQQDALREQTDPAFRAQQSMERLQEAHDAASEAVERYGPKSKEAERANRDLASAAVAAKGDMLAFQAGIDDGTLSVAAYDAQMDRMVRDGILPADAAEAAKRHFREIKETAESIEGVDPQVTIRVAHLDALEALRAFDEQLARIPRNITTTLGTRGRLEPKAHGGPVQAGRPYIVGEKRPELFVPSQSGRILPHVPRHAGGMASGGMNVTINMPNYLGSKEQVAEVIRRELVKVQRRNGTSGIA